MKTFEEIMNGVTDKIHYSKHAEQLTSLALTRFAEKIEKKGAIILTCSPKQIKLDDGTIIKVIGNYLKYTYNKQTVYYIQFDSNPFFGAMGYITELTGDSTAFIELPMVYYDVNPYEVEETNIQTLTLNIYKAECYLKTLSRIRKNRNTKCEQHIYYF